MILILISILLNVWSNIYLLYLEILTRLDNSVRMRSKWILCLKLGCDLKNNQFLSILAKRSENLLRLKDSVI